VPKASVLYSGGTVFLASRNLTTQKMTPHPVKSGPKAVQRQGVGTFGQHIKEEKDPVSLFASFPFMHYFSRIAQPDTCGSVAGNLKL